MAQSIDPASFAVTIGSSPATTIPPGQEAPSQDTPRLNEALRRHGLDPAKEKLFSVANGSGTAEDFAGAWGSTWPGALTEEALNEWNGKMKAHLQGVSDGPDEKPDDGPDEEHAPRPNLHPLQLKRYNALMEVLRTGEFDARSALGNRMRQLYPDKKLNQMPPEEAEKWKREFVNLELKPLCVVKTETQSWSRADLTSAEYEPFGAIVVRLGGRDDPEAVQGAIVGTSKCLLMGPPWWRRHPQTEMIEFIILRIMWQDAFEK